MAISTVRRMTVFAQFIRINNPQAVAWVVAAEGTISVGSSNSKGRKYYYPTIGVFNTNKQFISEFWELVGFYGSANYKSYQAYPNRKPCYSWVITKTSECLNFLKEVRPFLPIKEELADLVMEYCERRLLVLKQRNNMEDRDYEIIDKVRELNKRGTG